MLLPLVPLILGAADTGFVGERRESGSWAWFMDGGIWEEEGELPTQDGAPSKSPSPWGGQPPHSQRESCGFLRWLLQAAGGPQRIPGFIDQVAPPPAPGHRLQ